jgi:hypothetical protein
MSTEEDRLEKVKEKLTKMNQKSKNAQALSKQYVHNPVKEVEKPQTKVTPENSYFFQISELLIQNDFDEEEIINYLDQVETLSKKSNSELNDISKA